MSSVFTAVLAYFRENVGFILLLRNITLHYITGIGRRSYPERRTTKCITITRNKCVENPRGQ
uniref:Uncharacterized protein n=1 Tax=Anguilla anguilla TaxID=7936 RepID=A0A0E9WC64_ANGAN